MSELVNGFEVEPVVKLRAPARVPAQAEPPAREDEMELR